MNAVKIALLGTAALAAVSVSARADDLSDLKAQIEGLNSRISQLESTPSVPAGYQLLSISETDAIIVPGLDSAKDKFYGKKATNIGVMPTADVPASTNIQWSGFVRAGLLYASGKYRTDDVTIATGAGSGNGLIVAQQNGKRLDVVARAGIKVVGTTDTAVGEVGVRIALLAKSEGFDNRTHPSVGTDGVWGWWKITPELTLGGGVDGSLGNSSNAFDNRCTCAYIATGGAFGHGDPTQIRLSYASGPISFAVAVEDEANRTVAINPSPTELSKKSALGVAGEMKYSGDTIGFDLNAAYWDSVKNTPATSDSAWTVNAGANMALGDIAKLGVAIGVGEDKHLAGSFDRYAKASVFMGFTLSDAVSAELGGAYTDYKGNSSDYTVGGGLYYTPVSQLTLGLEASYRKSKNVAVNETATQVHRESNSETVVDVISVWRF
jgi:opacity protein-like surface antigen